MVAKSERKANKTKASSRPERADFVGYVNITLTDEDAKDFAGWFEQQDLVVDAYLDLFDKGYQITLKFDGENDCYTASVSNWSVDAIDSGVIYTGRSNTIEGATWKAVYVWDRKLARNLNNGHVKGTRKDAF